MCTNLRENTKEEKMKTSDLIRILEKSMEVDGDMDVSICTNGDIYNCIGIDADNETLWIDGHEEEES